MPDEFIPDFATGPDEFVPNWKRTTPAWPLKVGASYKASGVAVAKSKGLWAARRAKIQLENTIALEGSATHAGRKFQKLKRLHNLVHKDTVGTPYDGLYSAAEKQPRNSSYTRPSSGHAPRTRRNPAGKGRSLDVGDVLTPAHADQFGAPGTERLSNTFGSKKGTIKGGAALSNYGAQKDLGSGAFGAGAGRVKGAVNLAKHPETWANRLMWVYVTDMVTKGVQDWRHWDKVSWMDTGQTATNTLKTANSDPLNQATTGFAKLLGAGTSIGNVFAQAGAATVNIPWFPQHWFAKLFTGKGESVEALSARTSNLMSDTVAWLSNGATGLNPWSAAANADANMGSFLEANARRQMAAIRSQLTESMHKNLTVSQNDYRMLAVGGVDNVVSGLRGSPEYMNQASKMKEAYHAKSEAEILREEMLRTMGLNKEGQG